MKSIAIIPARGGSKRLPGKNIMPLGDIPLIAHSIREAQRHPFIDAVYVSTDDAQIKAVALEYGAPVIDRPIALSGDTEPTVTALKHVVETLNFEGTVFLLQATNPLRPRGLLKEAFDIFTQTQSDSLMTVSRNHHKLGKIENNTFIPFNYEIGQRSQDLEPLYYENGLLYLMRSEIILQGKIMGEKHFPMIIDHPLASVDIDTQADFELAECLFKIYPQDR
jgi:CMP-N-acetylneuraminic acid synthetase